MSWTWRYERADGTVVDPPQGVPAEPFPAQGDAESWVGEVWRELLDAGVDAVTLFEDDRLVYGPMSLHPAG
jgi:hypothetical protein